MLKKRYLFPLIFCIVLCAIGLTFGLAKLSAYGQRKTEPIVKNSTSANKEIIGQKTVAAKTSISAPTNLPVNVTENAQLKNSLAWTFGGKTQRGWYLYVSLIQQTIGTEASAETPEFAQSVAAWQSKSNLKPTGVIDAETLSKFVKSWQAQRLNSSQYPSDEQLYLAPGADFYDPSRSAELRKVEREAYAAYKQMIAAATAELKLKTAQTGELAPSQQSLKIVSSFRSREYQNKLRAASPSSGRAGLAVNSPHFTGHALDIYVGGEPVSTKDENRAIQVETPEYKWLVKNASRFGFYPYFYEPWHWEYVPRNLSRNL